MESADINPSSPSDERLEAWLRQTAEPLPRDDGFSARVLSSLPPPVRTQRSSRTHVIAGVIGGLAGLVLVVVRAGTGSINDSFGHFSQHIAEAAWDVLSDGWLLLAFGAAVLGLFGAAQTDEELEIDL